MLCALVLHVARQLELEKRSSENGESCTVGDVRTVFFLMDKEYPEMLAFMREFAHRFQLNVAELNCGFKEGLTELVNGSGSRASLPMKAMFTGTRRDDPNGRHQQAFCPTDPSWPALMRVNPILELQYHDIWTFIRIFHLPYCKLYDMGYTSIGTMDDTTTNEGLWSHLIGGYLPPWRLADGQQERLGRGLKRFLKNPAHPHLLAYPGDILKIITSFLGFRDLTRLHASGCKNLNEKLAKGVQVVRYLEKHDPNPQIRRRVTLGLESKFGDLQALELDFSVELETMSATSKANAFELDFTKELPKSLQSLVLCNPCSAIPAASSVKRELTSSSTEISPNTHGTLHTESTIDLPQLRSLRIQHQMPVAPFSLNRIACPNLTHLTVGQFPLDLDWLATLTKLETLSFHFRTISAPLPLPASLTDLSLHHMHISDLEVLKLLPAGLTSLRVKVDESLVESLLTMLPQGLLNMYLCAPSFHYSESWRQLPPALQSLSLVGSFTSDWEQNPISGAYSSVLAEWLSTLPDSLIELFLTEMRPLPADVAWRSSLRNLDSFLAFSTTRHFSTLPPNLEMLRVFLGHRSDQAPSSFELALALPSKLTKLVGFSFDFRMLPDLPNTLTQLTCSDITSSEAGANAVANAAVAQLKTLPRSLTELVLRRSHLQHAAIYTLPAKLRSLVLESEEGLQESAFGLLPRHLATLSVRNRSVQVYGSALSQLPPYLTQLLITPSKLDLPEEHAKREVLPTTLTHVVLGSIRVFIPL